MQDAPRGEFLDTYGGVPIAGFSFTPHELFAEISKLIPDFSFTYDESVNEIAARFAQTWPDSLDAVEAKEHIDFAAELDLHATVVDILDAHKRRTLSRV